MEKNMNKKYHLHTSPKALQECIVLGEKYRFSVLTDKMIRLEYSTDGIFEDNATQSVVNRVFDVPKFRVIDSPDQVEIITEYLQLSYDKKEFSVNGLNIRLKRGAYSNHSIWHYGERGDNLKGTARTLDNADGAIELDDGVLSRNGYAIINDSTSLILDEKGWVHPSIDGHLDLYFLGYGHNYLECLNDFFHLCGKTPMLPRFTLGNWWSRYYPYTQEEYVSLMDRFCDEKLPFSVAVFDMDWHYVRLEEKYGNGWTGYSWNKELFPDHKGLIQELKNRGIHITLNVHPADGVRGHEDAYVPMAKSLGVDYEGEIPISFDIASPQFLEAYFKYLHTPLEEEGVEFWWIDWQQGNTTKIPGLDPLWMLNHYHYLDNGKNGKRPLIFSRYAGVGSHRYPIGFSGDTVITWETLQFQPYFTATASNVGYGWWSHDIGGHMNGYRDDELTTRWVQFGVFSPIMRLHSSCNTFTGKEPWKFANEERRVMGEFLRLRHQLIPYLYTMNERFFRENKPLIQPMYYSYPEQNEAYEVQNQYYYGSELIVNPITTKMDTTLRAGKVKTWLPEGLWFDFFTGLLYMGNRTIMMYRPLDQMPVLAKAGAIIPLQKEETVNSHTDNPKDLELCVFAGANGEFVMYEDDGISLDYEDNKWAKTTYSFRWENHRKELVIHPAMGELSCIPQFRNYTIKLYGVTKDSIADVKINGISAKCMNEYDENRNMQMLTLNNVSVIDKVEIMLQASISVESNKKEWRVYEVLNRAQIDYNMKEKIYYMTKNSDPVERFVLNLESLDVLQSVKEAILEIVLAG
jgi:alpha-glucosidase (family GH31 glycosyl hydrolase)